VVAARRTPAGDTYRRLSAAVASGGRRPDVRVTDHVPPVTGSGDGDCWRRASERRGTVVIVFVVVVVVGVGRRR